MAQHVDPNRWRGTVRGRLLVVALLFLAWVVAIEARLVVVQVIQRDHWVHKANNQQLRKVTIPARRGEIVDRNGVLLATSVELPSLAVDPRLALDPKLDRDPKLARDPKAAVADLCAALGDCSPQEVQGLLAKFDPEQRYLLVRERITPKQAARLGQRYEKGKLKGKLKLPWVDLSTRPWRFYPNRELAAHVLGTVDIDGRGIAGVELRYDKEYLRGRDGSQVVLQTQGGVALQREGAPPTAGNTLELTIDKYLQFEAEAALREAVATHQAAAGCALVIASRSGEILALANVPTFNPNIAFGQASDEQKRNRVVQDAYEPGSTFKVVTATAALEQKVIRPDDIVNTGNGRTRIGNHTVSDTHAHGAMTFREVITKSSNIGAAIVGERLGRDRLGRYVISLGFGKKLLPDVGGESTGWVGSPTTWRDDTVQTVAYGYGVSATPLQLAAALNAVANGGELVRPRLLRAVIQGDSRTLVARDVIRRAMLPETAAQLTDILEGVTVEGGTATTAAIDGYTVAGKTGTAQKIINGQYSASNHRGSFIGFVPSRDPVVTILVMLDNPHGRGYYGGVVAAPAFKRIAEAALRRLAVAPTINPIPPVLVERQAPHQVLPVVGPVQPLTIVPARPLGQGELLLPELHGMSGRAAVLALSRLGLEARVTGDGVVTAQEPAAGTPMEPGSSCRLWLTRIVPNPPPGPRP